jgi:hypothetical protein
MGSFMVRLRKSGQTKQTLSRFAAVPAGVRKRKNSPEYLTPGQISMTGEFGEA